ncbi:hypothetical protein HDU87_002249 [Geranomyces variabilis]|uniref:DNA primase large subunit n=1 Tax=Geranomyces variabilis TaxID=109894 RepID=A0AAD5TNQ4_9FUNG|nr:hypothetical protein HDU87_002249 [Geranomyces variabilis]
MLKQNRTYASGATASVAEVTRYNDSRLGPYPFSLNFYSLPPPYELTLNEFETYALDRLRVLKAVETAALRTKDLATIDRYIQVVHDEHTHLNRNVRINAVGATKLYEERRKDHISHFILRLAYCRTPDLRKWLVRQETALFMYRFRQEEQAERARFVKELDIDMPIVTDRERAAVAMQLRRTHGYSAEKLERTVFYRVPFENVLRLVQRRAVFVKDGWAYVPERDQPVLIAGAYKAHLTAALEATAKAVPRMDEDDRLVPVLASISKQYLSNAYAPAGGDSRDIVRHNEVDSLATHFPPCMRNLHSALRRDHHLKHVARLQFGLFLKGVGMPLEEALIFWRSAFAKITDDQFQKSYAYNVRYNYGLEGKRTNYTPYSCVKIITSNQPAPSDVHGCPFKEFSKNDLRLMMKGYGVGDAVSADVARLAKDGHYQVACTRLYESTGGRAHRAANAALAAGAADGSISGGGTEGGGVAMVQTVEHPNQWFDMSRMWAAQNQKPTGSA